MRNKIRNEDGQEKQAKKEERKQKKIRIKKVGTRRRSVIALWLLLVGSVSFGIYKNFTAVDTHHETVKEIVEMKLLDTNSIESFVENFAKAYYSWENSEESIEKRTAAINGFLTEELQNLNVNTVEAGVNTSASVNYVQIWKVDSSSENEYDVAYTVSQTVSEAIAKNEKGKKNKKEEDTENVTSAVNTMSHKVRVHVDESGNMVIIKNPTICSTPKKSSYKPEERQVDGTVDAAIIEQVTDFLNTFFAMYPTATDKELAYYVKDNALQSVNGQYVFMEIVNPIVRKEDEKLSAFVSVKFYDVISKTVQISQYDLILQKDDNWRIVESR